MMCISIGMMCTLVALIIIAIILLIVYKNKESVSNHPIIIGMSLIALTISVTTAIYLFFANSINNGLNISYGDTSVTVLSVLVAILLGWNIYQIIDVKSIETKYKKLNNQISDEINYLNNKVNYNTAVSYGRTSQMIGAVLADVQKAELKGIMFLNALISIKSLVNMPPDGEYIKEYESIANTLNETIKATTSIELKANDANYSLRRLHEIKGWEKIKGLSEVEKYLLKVINKNKTEDGYDKYEEVE